MARWLACTADGPYKLDMYKLDMDPFKEPLFRVAVQPHQLCICARNMRSETALIITNQKYMFTSNILKYVYNAPLGS